MGWVVEHGRDKDAGPYRTPIVGVDDVNILLDRLDAKARSDGQPAHVRICPTGGGWPILSLGVGRDEFSFLAYNHDHVRGDLDSGRPAAWMFDGEWSELPPEFCVEVRAARQAAEEFVRSGGQRPTNLHWANG